MSNSMRKQNGTTSIKPENREKRKAMLKECEDQITFGRHSYHTIGENFKKIKDKEFYLDSEFNDTFEIYAKKQWGYGKSILYVYIHATEVWDNLIERDFDEEDMPDSAKALELLYGFGKSEQASIFKKSLNVAKDEKEKLMIKHIEKTIISEYPARSCVKTLWAIIGGMDNMTGINSKRAELLKDILKIAKHLKMRMKIEDDDYEKDTKNDEDDEDETRAKDKRRSENHNDDDDDEDEDNEDSDKYKRRIEDVDAFGNPRSSGNNRVRMNNDDDEEEEDSRKRRSNAMNNSRFTDDDEDDEE